MKLKISCFLLTVFVVVSFALNACGADLNQSITLQPSPSLVTSTPIPVISTLTQIPTMTPTNWLSALLTTTPIRYPLPALPPDCGTVKLSSAGTQTMDGSHKTLVQGMAILCGQIYFPVIGRPETITVLEALIDLDAGMIVEDFADLEFYPGAGSMIFYGFRNVNNSSVMVYSLNGLTMEHAKEPTFAECQGITQPSRNDHDNEPEYACVITNLGNISRIKVEQYNPLGNDAMALEISFITWEK